MNAAAYYLILNQIKYEHFENKENVQIISNTKKQLSFSYTSTSNDLIKQKNLIHRSAHSFF